MTSIIDAASLFGVEGMVAVVTGGGSGIGLYIAKALCANGAKAVYIIGRREATLREAAKLGKNGRIIPVVGDATKKESLAAIADRIRAEHGYLNAVIANAGIEGPMMDKLMDPSTADNVPAKEFVDFFWQAGEAAFTNTFHVNTTAVFFTALAFLDLLMKGNEKRNIEQRSQILVTTSIGAYLRVHPSPAYAASKMATAQLVKLLCTMWAQYGIRVNTIAPGYILSDMTQGIFEDMGIKEPGKEGAFPRSMIPSERCGTEQDVAGTVLYALSKAGGYVNGATLSIDGGLIGRSFASY